MGRRSPGFANLGHTEQMRVSIQSPDWIGWRINETLGLDGRTAKKDRDILQLIIAHLKKEHLITKFRKHDKKRMLRHHWRPVQKKFVAME